MTLNEQEWDEVEHLVNGEYMTQVEDAGFEAALAGVRLAMAILQSCPIQAKSLVEVRQQALDYIAQYGFYEEAPIKDLLTKEDLHAIHVKQCGSEEETTAQERYDFLHNSLKPAHDDHPRLWHQDAQGLWHLLESTQSGSGVWTFYYEQGQNPEQMRTVGSPDYLYRRELSALLHEVRDQFKVDIYDIPVEQWTLSPEVKES
jgi:hypothetical protein